MRFLSKFENSSVFWLICAAIFISFVLIAHFFFQIYLFMKPCEQCVYLRFDFLIIAFAFILIAFKLKILKLIGYFLGFFGIILGFNHALILNKIHHFLKTNNPFSALAGCKSEPEFIFNLPLHEILPSLFLPNGECGFDKPFVPSGVMLDKFQEFFINLYQNGWYLLPKFEFVNMAQMCLIILSAALILLCFMLLAFAFNEKLFKNFS